MDERVISDGVLPNTTVILLQCFSFISKEHAEAVRQEVKKLKQAGAIKEVFYPEWLANTVVVKKKSGK